MGEAGESREGRAGLDLASLRAEIPALDQAVHGRPLVYLDNASTKAKADAAITQLTKYDLMDAYTKALDEHGRQSVDAAVKSAKAGSRAQVQAFANATCSGPFYGQSHPGNH